MVNEIILRLDCLHTIVINKYQIKQKGDKPKTV